LFAVPFALFIAWMAYLGWLVAGRPLQAPGYPLVVSEPQVLVSEIDIIGELDEREDGGPDTATTVKVVEVLYNKTGKGPKVGTEIQVEGLSSCHPVKRGKEDDPAPPNDWNGPGQYLILLARTGKQGEYRVVAVPKSPGFYQDGLLRVYPATAEVLAQYQRIKARVKGE
jgi:hypothetical protein